MKRFPLFLRRFIAHSLLGIWSILAFAQFRPLLIDAVVPPLDPAPFHLPSTAQEIVHLRTEHSATFEIGRGRFAQVGGIQPEAIPSFLPDLWRILFPDVLADSSGPNSPGTVADDAAVGTMEWTDVDYAKISDDSYAESYFNWHYYPDPSHYLKATNFGFSIPAGSIIDGILVEINKKEDSGAIKDSEIKIVKSDSSIGTTNKATANEWPYLSFSYFSYGGASDLWGETWAASDINDADFGVVLSAVAVDGDNSGYARIDHIRMTVTYTAGAAPAPDLSTWALLLLLPACAYVLERKGLLGMEVIDRL
ncbi:MAG: hypothetical protein PHS73_01070 [Candidatus Peribacteraceae bacterium]|nr:hypothetical protein [Candidatus Peribacteraceae bacterium]